MSRSSVAWEIGAPGWVSIVAAANPGFTRSIGAKRISSTGRRSGGPACAARRRRVAYSSGWNRQRGEPGVLAPGGFLANRNGLGQVVEVARREFAEFGQDQDESMGRSDASELRTFCSVRMFSIWLVTPISRGQVLALHQRRAEVDRDDDVGAHGARHVHGRGCRSGRHRRAACPGTRWAPRARARFFFFFFLFGYGHAGAHHVSPVRPR